MLKIDDFHDENDGDFVRGKLTFYHYKCDGINDSGWGCGYRTLQSLCSWIVEVKNDHRSNSIPSIRQIQEILVELGDKPLTFLDSNQWIGTCEAAMVLSQLYDVDCKLVHVPRGDELRHFLDLLSKHFREFGSPVMMGGDGDAASKCIVAVRSEGELLILDPHYSGRSLADRSQLRQSGYLRWYNLSHDFISSSFYNLCLPQIQKKYPQ